MHTQDQPWYFILSLVIYKWGVIFFVIFLYSQFSSAFEMFFTPYKNDMK